MNGRPQVFAGRIIFDHLPKTAGQAVNTWLTKALGNGCVTPNLIGQHRDLIRRYGGNYSVISAHVHFEGNGLDPRYRYMSCFREPIDRAISWLFFVLKNHTSSQLQGVWEQAERFLSSQGDELGPWFLSSINNPYVEHFSKISSTAPRSGEQKLADALSSIEQYDVWGIYEEMPAFLADVAALIGLPAPSQLERVNVTRTRPAVEQITPSLRKRLEEVNTLDLELYRVLRERWQRDRIKRATISLPEFSPWEPYDPVLDRIFSVPEFTLLAIELGERGTFTRGETLCFELKFSLTLPMANLEIGIHIFDEDGRRAFGTNTSLMGLPLLQIDRGTHLMHYYLVADLPEGQYSTGFTFAERNAENNRELAWYDKLIKFRITTPKMASSVGYESLPVEFDCKQTSNAVLGLVENAAGKLESDAALLGNISEGATFNLPVRLVNASSQIWVSTVFNPIKLSYRWLDQAGNTMVSEGFRSPLPAREVMPGQTIMTRMRVVAPSIPGRYRLLILPVQEEHCWFDDKGFTPFVQEIDVVALGDALRYPGADMRLSSQVGRREGSAMVSTGREGFLLFGPYAQLPAGRYIARLEGRYISGSAGAWVDVGRDKSSQILARQEVNEGAKAGVIAELPFELSNTATDLEVRLWVKAAVDARVEALLIEPEGVVMKSPLPVEAG